MVSFWRGRSRWTLWLAFPALATAGTWTTSTQAGWMVRCFGGKAVVIICDGVIEIRSLPPAAPAGPPPIGYARFAARGAWGWELPAVARAKTGGFRIRTPFWLSCI